MAAISCHEEAFLSSEAPSGIHQGDILPGMWPFFCLECASRMLYSKDAPSSARNGPRKSSVQECIPSLSENALQRCFVRGPSSAQANERWLVRCSAHVGLPLRCRGALGDAVLRSFGCWMSSLMRMAAERAEHGRVQVQVRVRVRMPLLPRRCRVLAGDSDYRVLHGVDVLGHCAKRGVGERLGNHVNQGFGGRRHRGVSSLRALTAAMRIARKRNRSPQNGAGRDDGSSQRSLL